LSGARHAATAALPALAFQSETASERAGWWALAGPASAAVAITAIAAANRARGGVSVLAPVC
jgi:hypothetical protein